ncbi:55feba01-52d5-4fac-89df-6ce94a3976b6 [Sclerotinia trifoliorum]|uniref:55feba01-52d5-4fac-89df-6ce94a3976b6 n=1 Tax=Sclerotinia trifoliorum TaxID=28548 RepID=A0A8H2VSP1_9HELO|nr:55feba01-52d5-4fac-89df-6ce94a3976b6 [Sclerotinia trifoliorum]
MASITAPTPDTLVTLKINIEGSNRRFKLPLRDLGASTLPDKLRYLLAIPPTSEAIFERYSDSAAAFIVLDSTNPSVYKQLYRAAKAKLKLRLKVTIKDKVPVMPKPATVEDEVPTPAKIVEAKDMHTSESAMPASGYSESSKTREVANVEELERGRQSFHDSVDTMQKTAGDAALCAYKSQLALAESVYGPLSTDRVSREEKNNQVDDSKASLPKPAARSKSPPPVIGSFAVYCNGCNAPIPDIHYHCSTCDDGDFDLCPDCNDNGVTCNGDHWLIKRIVDKGKYIHSTTEKLAPKQFSAYRPVVPKFPQYSASQTTLVAPAVEEKVPVPTRTCNSCIVELSEDRFVTCTDCDDFDLCIQCHLSLKHGHNPKHAFAFVDEDATHSPIAHALLAPGRNAAHAAVCDGCDKYIFGVRHKCLDCPDWDYCDSCIANASFIHPRHRFVPLYESNSSTGARQQVVKARHHGIFCDGPLCNRNGSSTNAYITGDRYKCAVCHDTDFCACCEASPSNPHNKTHPLIKFKTPVRNVSVTTLGDHPSGRPMAPMGDRRPEDQTISKATETTPAQSTNAATQVQTVAEVKPIEVKSEEPIKAEETAVVEETAKELPAPVEEELIAHFVRDAVADGTIMTPNSVFEQTWYLRNGGKTSWPAGCSVRFVGGDNMCAVDPEHPASVHELVSAAESTTCYTEVAPGQEYGFTVLMRTPNRAGNFISYWRLTTPTGEKFGHRLWCDITVNEPTPIVKEEPEEEEKEVFTLSEVNDMVQHIEDERAAKIQAVEVEAAKNEVAQVEAAKIAVAEFEAEFYDDAVSSKAEGSQMIFPKLDKESPISSVHEEAQQAAERVPASEEIFNDDFEEFNQNFEEDEADDGFMTDEEYDILDASDEEYLAEQESVSKK